MPLLLGIWHSTPECQQSSVSHRPNDWLTDWPTCFKQTGKICTQLWERPLLPQYLIKTFTPGSGKHYRYVTDMYYMTDRHGKASPTVIWQTDIARRVLQLYDRQIWPGKSYRYVADRQSQASPTVIWQTDMARQVLQVCDWQTSLSKYYRYITGR